MARALQYSHRMKLLVVDDEPSICFAISEYFGALGYQVDCAEQAEEAQSLLDKGCYAVLIADLRLAGIGDMGGLEVIRSAKQRCPARKNIVLTAYGSTEVEAAVRRYGVDAFLQKPKPLAEVAQVVFDLVSSVP